MVSNHSPDVCQAKGSFLSWACLWMQVLHKEVMHMSARHPGDNRELPRIIVSHTCELAELLTAMHGLVCTKKLCKFEKAG